MSLMETKVRNYKEEVAGLAGTIPGAAQAYHAFTGECFSPGELDERTKQLIALGIAMFANNEVCTFYHAQEARSHGANERQIMEAAAVAAAAASGHVMSQGVMRLQTESSGRHGMQDYLQDTEFSAGLGDKETANVSETVTFSPSY